MSPWLVPKDPGSWRQPAARCATEVAGGQDRDRPFRAEGKIESYVHGDREGIDGYGVGLELWYVEEVPKG